MGAAAGWRVGSARLAACWGTSLEVAAAKFLVP